MSRLIQLLLSSVLLGAILSCQAPPKKSVEPAPEESSDLNIHEAQSRKERLRDIHYTLSLQLDEIQNVFSGTNRIDFDLSGVRTPLRVDFFEGTVTSIRLNDQPLDLSAKKTYWIELPPAALREGKNTLLISYNHEFSNQGQGLHRFVDPETKDVFLYSQFETFDANRFMPCFDQPDLRATLDLEVTAPRAWEVMTATRETETKILAPDRQFWKFQATPKIATYLFSLHAGPFKVWKDDFKGLPLRLFARPQLARYVDAKKWFQVTKQGLQFYNSYYEFPYPFKKYDQILVPEFNAGAMENVGAVTFSERYISRSSMPRDQWRNLSGTILHEMAHMWFGDLVTMRWWNDLWLNESFATYMSNLAMFEATEYKESWQEFHVGEKDWAYWQDSLLTTHPIEAPVTSVKEAFANFDGITYGKGASVLKQLSTYIGPQKFQTGVRSYLKAHAFDNAELKDFIIALQAQTPKNLMLWADRWLKQSGTDVLSTSWTCEGGRLKNIAYTMTPVPNTRFRPQKFISTLYKMQGAKMRPVGDVTVELESPEKTIAGDWACPDMIYPNSDDSGYFAVRFDAKSLQTIQDHLSDVPNTLVREMVWSDLWRMVRLGEMSLKDYVAVVNRHFTPENDDLILKGIVGTVSGSRSEEETVLYFWPIENPASRAAKEKFVAHLETDYKRRLSQAPQRSDQQKFWYDSYEHIVQTPAGLDDLAARMQRPDIAPKFPWDPDRQWRVVHRLERFSHPQADALLARMKKLDPSERGQKEVLAADAVRPALDVKQKWVTLLKEPKPKISLSEAHSVLWSLFPVEQTPLAKNFKNDFYDYLKKNGDSENMLIAEAVLGGLAPLYCESTSVQELRHFMKSTRLSPSVRKELMNGIEEDERCQRIRTQSGL